MKKAKLFINGRSQAVRLPQEFRLPGSEVYIKKSGDIIQLIPIKKNPWDDLEKALSMFDDSFFSEERKQGKPDDREDF